MRKTTSLIVAAAMSVGLQAQEYSQGQYPFGVVASVATGKVELEGVDDDQNIHSASLGLEFQDVPFVLELRYSSLQEDDVYSYSRYVNDVLTDQLSVDGNIDNWGVAGKLDLSWNCTDSCVYLMAGYNTGELTLDADLNGENAGSYSTDANYPHWGVGFRHDFAKNLRATVEYLSYDMGKQDLEDVDELGLELGEIDLGTATAWQAGIGYRF